MKLVDYVVPELCTLMGINERDITNGDIKRLVKKGHVDLDCRFTQDIKKLDEPYSPILTLVKNGLVRLFLNDNTLVSITLDDVMMISMKSLDLSSSAWGDTLQWYCKESVDLNMRNALKELYTKMEPMLKSANFKYEYTPDHGLLIDLHDEDPGVTHKYAAHLMFIVSVLPDLEYNISIYQDNIVFMRIMFARYIEGVYSGIPPILTDLGIRYNDRVNVIDIFEGKDIESLFNIIGEKSRSLFWKSELYTR